MTLEYFSVGKLYLWTSVRDRGSLCKANCTGTQRPGLGSFPAQTDRHRAAGLKGRMLLVCSGVNERSFLPQPSSSSRIISSTFVRAGTAAQCAGLVQTEMWSPWRERKNREVANLPRLHSWLVMGSLPTSPQASDFQRANRLHFTCMNASNPPKWPSLFLVSYYR